jgi:hypothetical protein
MLRGPNARAAMDRLEAEFDNLCTRALAANAGPDTPSHEGAARGRVANLCFTHGVCRCPSRSSSANLPGPGHWTAGSTAARSSMLPE